DPPQPVPPPDPGILPHWQEQPFGLPRGREEPQAWLVPASAPPLQLIHLTGELSSDTSVPPITQETQPLPSQCRHSDNPWLLLTETAERQ
ncbi:hypothetical protein P7K49_003276, partial [Saguinus oedipus]